ncbi:MAG TPA: FAD-dependent oxidoreductase, partial [Methanocorpusculum sp.]|nr:FAD-dependent oxidoreductase [Methanocorpusculum sp.]
MKYDTVIIGFGKAGKTLAAALADKGEKVALIEKSPKMYGGTCINVGCVPSKSLVISSAEAALHKDDDFKTKAQRYKNAVGEKRRVTEFLRKKNFDKLNNSENITIYNGLGRFAGEKDVEVLLNEGGSIILNADKIFINTGAKPRIPQIEGICSNPYVYTSETLMDEENLPERLVLIGAGYIGMEFASMYADFGSKVTVLQDGDIFLPKEDRDVADEIRKILEHRGIEFWIGAKILRIENNNVIYETDGAVKTAEADAILIAAGREANTEDLRTDIAGIKLTKRGAIEVDELLRTNIPGVWALGDVNGGPQFTFISLDDFRIIMSQLQGGSYSLKKRLGTAYSVFMDTPLSRVGMTEAQARSENLPIRVIKIPASSVPKAQVLRKTEGFLKAVINTETNKILGAALLCPESYELINTVKLAMDLGADYQQLRDAVYTHPTMTEAFNDLF